LFLSYGGCFNPLLGAWLSGGAVTSTPSASFVPHRIIWECKEKFFLFSGLQDLACDSSLFWEAKNIYLSLGATAVVLSAVVILLLRT
jgi:hypothetical protein